VFVIPGYTTSDKVPGVVARGEYGAGKLSIGQIPLLCVLYGNIGSSGTAPLNSRSDCTTPEEADTLCSARSELARMAHAALDVPGVTLKLVPVEEVSGGTAATFVLDIGGSWSTSGELTLQLDEEVIRCAVAASHTATTFGDALEDKANQAQNGRLFCTASNTAGRVTFTVFNLGVRGNQHVAFLDKSLLPSGMTVVSDQLSDVVKVGTGPNLTVAGSDTVDGTYVITISTGGTIGTAMATLTINGGSPSSPFAIPAAATPTALTGTSAITLTSVAGTYVLGDTYTFTGVAALSNGGVPFSGGAGTDDLDDAIDGTESVTNDYIGLAHNDVTNVGKMETAVNAKAAFDVARLEQYVACRNRGLTDGIALGQAGMNDQLGTCLWSQNHVEHPSRLAARLAALFSITDGGQPNTNYDEVVLTGAAPHKSEGDNPNRSTLNSALNNSLTPLVTVDGKLQIVRAICSRSLNGSTPDYRTYDHGDVAVAIRVRKEAVALGQSLKAGNPHDGPDVSEGLPPAGTFTPRRWEAEVNALLEEWASERFNWLQDVKANPCQALWDPVAKRTMSVIPTIAKHLFHQLGVIVRQQAA
jgi:phage tail sheath gpL-like